jgi:micrococcal nuclease
MPSRAYVAHDQAVSVVRMYLQMTVIGFVVGSGLYCGLMAAFLSHLLACPALLLGASAKVLEVIDGDTIKVLLDGKTESVRLIGVDTPETVHPNKPVERFGKEASDFTKQRLNGQTVRLETDPTGDTRDRYGRLLRHVSLEDGTLFNAFTDSRGLCPRLHSIPILQDGRIPRGIEHQARESGKGLWAGSSYEALFAQTETKPKPQAKKTEGQSQTVYITRTGSKYHAGGCSYLRKSRIPISLKDAKAMVTVPARDACDESF